MSNTSRATNVSHMNLTPVCQWSFNRAHQFHHVSGDSAELFRRPPADLSRQHVSLIDDPRATWAGRLDRMFRGQNSIEQSAAGEYCLFHIAVAAQDGAVRYIAGFAFRARSALPAASELELAAAAVLQVVESERAHATRFLHDIVAQSLSGTGLQLELLQLEIRARGAETLKHAVEIQKSLEQVLNLVREFSAPD